jgi:hypothetical protein
MGFAAGLDRARRQEGPAMARLKSKSLRRYPLAAYPTKLQILNQPDLLRWHVPPSWLAKAELAGTVSALLAAANAAGCSSQASQAANRGNARTMLRPNDPAMVAPISGEISPLRRDRARIMGRPAMPIVHLPEEEAMQIIKEALAQEGIDFSQTCVVLESVIIDGVFYKQDYDWVADNVRTRTVAQPASLVLDLKDPRHAVAVKYIDPRETSQLGGNGTPSWPGDDSKAAAGSVSQEVLKQGKGIYFGAFYYPGDELRLSEKWQRAGQNACNTECKRLLRLQVKSFTDWLKGQGVI